jgi:hypothetical protein
MTRTRARRLLRTAFGVWGFVCLTAGLLLVCTGHPWPGGAGLSCALACIIGMAIADPERARRHDRKAYEQRRRDQPATDWRAEAEVAKFNAEVSAWEAARKARP